jgi:hypothetical protein
MVNQFGLLVEIPVSEVINFKVSKELKEGKSMRKGHY